MSIDVPQSRNLKDILPKEPLLLMGAGPVPLPPTVAAANSQVINHLGPYMGKILEGVKQMGRYVFQTKSEKLIGISGPGSAAMEMAITNLLWPGRRVLVLSNGTFSRRFSEMASAVGAEVDIVRADGIVPISPDQVKKAMDKRRYDVVTMSQGETACGVKNIYIKEISKIVGNHQALFIVDAVCTLATTELKMDEWGIDVCVVAGQKGLSSIPGVSLIAFSNKAWECIDKRLARMPHWCLDAKRAWEFWGSHKYHYTAPTSGLLAIHEALHLITEETLEKRIKRHEESARYLQNRLISMGLEMYVKEDCRLNSVNAVKIPNGIDDRKLIEDMRNNSGVEIANAFGHPIFRIGQMGEQCRPENVSRTLLALASAAKLQGLNLDTKETKLV
ncbi:aminotransferase class V-fold PLP-dependent enzyme [Candidatus Saccharibacteria bacterium]|jgi:alanine-glyoxylate transaminase/serine-glyoxylate transaminase/serine-pyruvate transaminase|nr:aminotransferase class V-fold PLP-dependent enzyme [Candidatus Saccharibacteria bacterium]